MYVVMEERDARKLKLDVIMDKISGKQCTVNKISVNCA